MLALCLWPAVTPEMDLKPNSGSDRAWVWNTLADYADECPKAEFLAIRFLNAESEYSALAFLISLLLCNYIVIRQKVCARKPS